MRQPGVEPRALFGVGSILTECFRVAARAAVAAKKNEQAGLDGGQRATGAVRAKMRQAGVEPGEASMLPIHH